jgi:exonuclease SbcC
MITRVKLKGWKTHLNSDIRFGDGTNVLVGMMGAGKSAVLEAITYALFGTLPQVQMRRIKLDELIMNRPKQMDSAEVEVSFIAPDGEEYVVKRMIERGSGTTFSELRKASGELIESPSATRVSEAIQSILKLDYDLFERAVYSEQNRLDYFLTLPRGKRMESIDELLGIDKLEIARKNMGTLIHRIQERIDGRRTALNELRQDAALAALPVLEQGLNELELSKQGIQARLNQLQPELENVQRELQQLREVKERLAQLEKSLRELEGAIAQLNQRVEDIRTKLGAAVGIESEELRKQVASAEREFNEASSKAEDLSSKLTSSTSWIRELETKIKMYNDRLEKLSNEIEVKRRLRSELEGLRIQELVDSIEGLQAEMREVSDELAATRARLQDLEQTSNELAMAGSTCPVCESPLPEDRKRQLLEDRGARIENYRKRTARLQERLSELQELLNQKLELQRRAVLISKEVEDLQMLEVERSQIEQEIRGLKEGLASARVEADALRSEVDRQRREMEKLRERLQETKQLLYLREDLDRLELEHKRKLAESLRVRRELWQLGRAYDETRAEELEARWEELIRIHERLKAELAGKEQLIAERRKLIESLREKKAMIARYEVELKYLQQAVEALQKIQLALSRTQVSLRRAFIEAVNEAMAELWGDIYPYGDFTSIRLAVEGEGKGDYVLQLRDRFGNWLPVEGIASGGERTCACLALRIAFAIVLAPALSWLVLDEPTHNLDAEGIQELATALRERVPEIVRQVLLITHEERLEAAVSGYLYRFSRDKDTDQPTKIEQVVAPQVFEAPKF